MKAGYDARIRAKREKEREKEERELQVKREEEEREQDLDGWANKLRREHEVHTPGLPTTFMFCSFLLSTESPD